MTTLAEPQAENAAHDPYRALMEITRRPAITFTHGRGGLLWDSEGNRYLDFIQGWAVNCLGHSPPAVARALAEQSARLLNCSPAYYSEPMMRYANALTAAAGLERVFFANSGAEANEGAIKLARKWGAKHRGGTYEIVTTVGGFHGRTLATMSASGKAGWDGLFEPKVAGFPKVPLNDLAAVEAAVGDRTAAVMLEPIQGESGVWPADDGYLRSLRALADRRGILLILDEIQTGMGRTGSLFCFEHAGVRPDIVTLGKGIGAGTPLAALLAREEVCCFEPGDQGGTYNGNALMAAVGHAVLEELTADGFLERVCEAGAALRRGLESLSGKYGLGGVRGRGLLLALDLTPRSDGFALVEKALAKGLLLNAPAPDALRFVPALNVTDAEIAEMLDVLDGLLEGR